VTAKTTDTLAKRTRTGTFRGSILSRGFLAVFLGLSFGLALCLASPCLADNEPDPLFDDLFDEEFDEAAFEYPDPLETTNRRIFGFNRQCDKWLLDPLTKGYRFVVPRPARSALSRMFLNLGSPRIIVNDFLQLEWKDMAVTTTRFVINSTVGIVGLFDVAKRIGLPGHESDFGQTLALAGTPSGPYLVFPFLGPSNVRDATGSFTDVFFNPFVYFVAPINFLIYSGSSGLSERDRYYLELKALEDSSIDFYAALRSGYYQRRVGRIWGRRDDHRTSGEPHLKSVQADVSGEADVMAIPFERRLTAVRSPSTLYPSTWPLDLRSSILVSTEATSWSKPLLFSAAEYSDLRSASSLTVPFRKTSITFQDPSRSIIR
jgi:phospholipid-binding lipoprotein MlaA